MSIEITKLTSEDVGKWVHYKATAVEDFGRIKTWNDKWVFVVYSCDDQWDKFMDYTGEATRPDNITFCANPYTPKVFNSTVPNPLESIWRNQGTREHIPCTICGDPTSMLGTKLCNGCWEVIGRIPRFVCCENAYNFLKEAIKMYEVKYEK